MINSLKLINFRKFKELSLDLASKIVILTGANGIGKTSVLEAIYLIATTKSHRTTEFTSLLTEGETYSVVELKSEKNYKLIFNKNEKKAYVNDVFYPKFSEFIGQIPVVLFSPSDIELLQGSKSVRRRFLDLEISLLDKSYLRLIMAYKRLLKERNEILKVFSQEKALMLQVVTNQMLEFIEEIYLKRLNFLNQLNQTLKDICKDLQMETIHLKYLATYDIENLEKSFSSKLKTDIATKTTNLGIHRDDFLIEMDGQNAKEFASEGQGRNAVLAIKLAVMEFYKQANKDVLLLLDDVFSSMDQKRINHILEYIKNEPQTLITTTSIFNIPDHLIRDAKIIKL